MELGKIEVSWNTNFTMIPNEIWDLDLEMEERMIFMYLVKLKSNQGEVAFPSYPVIAEACKIRNKTGKICKVRVRRAIDKMNSIGLIKKLNRKKKNGEFGSNIYRMTHPSTLLTPVKSIDKEEEEYEVVTPVSKPKKENPSIPIKPTGSDVDTPVSEVEPIGNTDVEEFEESENVTYKDLPIKTQLKRKDDDRSTQEDREKKKGQSEPLKECYELISKATGLNLERVKMCIAASLLWKVDLKELIAAFGKSKYLQGRAEKKVPVSTFGSVTQLNKVIGGFYEDRPEEKSQGKSVYKLPKDPDVIRNHGQDDKKVMEDIKSKMTDLDMLKSEVIKNILKTGQVKLMAKLAPLNTLELVQKFRGEYHL